MGLRQCPCKFLLGIEETTATVTITTPNPSGPPTVTTLTSTINFDAEQCFTAAPQCIPAVNNFSISFGSPGGDTINFINGRRGTIFCTDNTVAVLLNGRARGTGNVIPNQIYTVDFTYTITGTTATITIFAVGEDGTTFETTFTATITPETFIGDCNQTP